MSARPMPCPGCFLVPWDGERCGSCGYERDADAFHGVLDVGTVLLERYRTGRILGRPGGFGVTYLALDERLHRRVALKELMPREMVARARDGATLRPHSREDGERFESTRAAFLEEARTLARFSHPNVVRVLDYFEANSTAYFAMEFYEGVTLADRVAARGGSLPPGEAMTVARPLLEALEEVHAQGVLHRDLKPSNIYLTQDDRPVILDFGSARQSLGTDPRTLTSVLTPGYAPFEQYHGRGDQGPWTDVYGAAATLYFVLTGQAPPEAGLRIEGEPLVPPAAVQSSIPPTLSEAVVHGLAIRPQERPRSARAFLALLTGVAPSEERPLDLTGPPPTVLYAGQGRGSGLSAASGGAYGPPGGGATRIAPPDAPGTSLAPPGDAGRGVDLVRRRRLPPAVRGAVAGTTGVLLAGLGVAWALNRPSQATSGAREPVTLSSPARSSGGEARPPSEEGPAGTQTTSTGRGDDPGAGPSREAPPPPAAGASGTSSSEGSPGAGEAAAAPTRPLTGVVVVLFGQGASPRMAESTLLGALLRVPGLTALDVDALGTVRGDDSGLRAALSGDFSSLAHAAAEAGAAFVVVGELATASQPARAGFHSGSATLDLRMYGVADGTLLGAESFSVGSGGVPARAGTSPAGAEADAARAVADAGAAAVARWARSARR